MSEAAYATEIVPGGVLNEIAELGLQRYIDDLDAHGYTVIPPEIANPNGLAERMLETCLDVAERRSGERPDVERGAQTSDSPVGDTMLALLLEDPVFEESLMNPALLAAATYLCGYDVVLSSLTGHMKGSNKSHFRLHTDTRLPSPLPMQALLCKFIYALTDFDRENGSTAFVPGSHKWCRNPAADETGIGGVGNHDAVPVEAAAGSLIVFHGNAWHSAYDRRQPGLRVSVHLLMVRSLLRATEDFIGRIPQEALDRNPPRFGILTQQGVVPPYIDKDDQRAKVARAQQFVAAFEKDSGIRLPAKR
ncbi:MAG: phytanoyl-CoA dioxygenase family protein [Gammaproteobacteria bacterium]|nr:phytanoyl-CoA dioxygenase family protein [Gammaproteobacteria bacterium]